MSNAWEEYQHCKIRGHQSSGVTAHEAYPPWSVCKFCGTHYRHEYNLFESHVPHPPESEMNA